MSKPASFSKKNRQNIAFLGYLLGFILTVVLFIALSEHGFAMPAKDIKAYRLAFALKWSALPLFMLFMGIMVVQSIRYFDNYFDPLEGKDKKNIQVHDYYVRDTAIMSFMFVASMAIFSISVSFGELEMIPVLSLIFVVGRVLYWMGFLKDTLLRTPGAMMTEMVTFLPLVYVTYLLIHAEFLT